MYRKMISIYISSLFLFTCVLRNEQSTDNNIVKVFLDYHEISDIDYAEIEITAYDMDPILIAHDIEQTNPIIEVYNIPAGSSREFSINAYNSEDTLIFSGYCTMDLRPRPINRDPSSIYPR
ncbi:MAG: hypothetical protein ABIA04_03195 [Pseudomonadota bacterium]